MAHKTMDGTVQVFDITTFLWHARCFAVLIRPFLMISRGTVVVVSWKFPKLTLAVWLCMNLMTTVVPTEYSLAIFLIFLSTCVGLGVLHHYTQIFIKLFPDGELENSALQAYLQRSWGDEQKILEEYRRVLYKIDSLLLSMNATLETFYNILKWESPLASCCWALVIGTWSIMLYLVDLRSIAFVTNNAVLLGSGWYLRTKNNRQRQMTRQQSPKTEVLNSIDNDTATQIVDEFRESDKPEPNMDNDESDAEDSDLVDVDDQDSSQLIDASSKLAKESGTERPNMVKKLMDLRKRHHQANAGQPTDYKENMIMFWMPGFLYVNFEEKVFLLQLWKPVLLQMLLLKGPEIFPWSYCTSNKERYSARLCFMSPASARQEQWIKENGSHFSGLFKNCQRFDWEPEMALRVLHNVTTIYLIPKFERMLLTFMCMKEGGAGKL